MKLLILASFLIFSASLSSAAEIAEELSPGLVNISLGDGYKASIELNNTVSKYDLEIANPESGTQEEGNPYKKYEFKIVPKDNDIRGMRLSVKVFDNPQHVPEIAYASEPTYNPGGNGPLDLAKKLVPITIDESPGYLVYLWNPGEEKSINEAFAAQFFYYPPARGTSFDEHLYTAEVFGNIGLKVSEGEGDLSDVLPILNSILNSINISGPAFE